MKRNIFVLCCLSLVFLGSCISSERIQGNGNLITEQLDISTYDRIVVRGSELTINYTQNEATPSLEVHTDRNIYEMFSFKTNGNTLEIVPKDQFRNQMFRPTKFIVTTNSPSLVSVSGSSGSAVNLVNSLKGDYMDANFSGGARLNFQEGAELSRLKINVSGGAQVKGEKLSLQNIESHVSGGARVTLEGTVDRGEFHVSGGGSVRTADLKGKEVNAQASGGGKLEVCALEKLTAQASGGASIRYKGNPDNIDRRTSGGGSVKPLD